MLPIRLSAGQGRVFATMLDGLSAVEASAALNLRLDTVRAHRRAILEAAGADNTYQLMALMWKQERDALFAEAAAAGVHLSRPELWQRVPPKTKHPHLLPRSPLVLGCPCGGKVASRNRAYTCQSCGTRYPTRGELYKAHRVCVTCGGRKASGRAGCHGCRERKRQMTRRWRASQPRATGKDSPQNEQKRLD